ncbi:MAG: OsmC family protein [Actinomycetota bacterium]|nr:OsmC family protein [Actinomycetota bacterium]
MDLRSAQKPLKDKYRSEPGSSRITLSATGSETDAPISCSVDIGRAVYAAEAHSGVGGMGTAACSGDLLLGALAACAQITCQMVASAMNIPTNSIKATAEGDLDLAGTLGISKDIPVGFEEIRLILKVDAPEATADQLDALHEKTEQYCVVMQTLATPPKLKTEWARDGEAAGAV